MKKELLRTHNLNYRYAEMKKLEQISVCILEGDKIGFWGLSQSGKDFLLQLFKGEVDVKLGNANIYVRGEKINHAKELKRQIYPMSIDNYRINWTVGEYVCLQNSRWLMMRKQEKILLDMAQKYFDELDVCIDVSTKMKDLTEMEKRVVDVVKAYYLGAAILVIEDEFEGMKKEELELFSSYLTRILSLTKMAVIVNSHSDMVMEVLSEKYIVFRNGKIVKKCKKENLKDKAQLETYLLGNTLSSRKKSMEAHIAQQNKPINVKMEIAYSVKNIFLQNQKIRQLDFYQGHVTTLLVADNKEREKLFNTISGRLKEENTCWIVENELFETITPSFLIEKKVVSVAHLGSTEEIFTNMDVRENLLMPSLTKIGWSEYVWNSAGLLKAVTPEEELFPDERNRIEFLETDERIAVTLERWYVYRPRVLILYDPFAFCDTYGVSVVKTYIKKFAEIGTAVIIIKSREEYIEDISDEIISMM